MSCSQLGTRKSVPGHRFIGASDEVLGSLLDMQVRNGEALLEKYGLKANDAVLANEQQQAM